jgi:hypothetical protein
MIVLDWIGQEQLEAGWRPHTRDRGGTGRVKPVQVYLATTGIRVPSLPTFYTPHLSTTAMIPRISA